MKVSLVIPAYNESGIILDTIRTSSKRMSELSEDYEILIVNDGSTDNTAALVRECGDQNVRLVSYMPNRGKGCAVRSGMLAAQGDIIICTDADLAYGVDVFGAILERFENSDAQLVIGSRRLEREGYRDYPAIRLLASKCFGLLVRIISGLKYDTQCGIKGYRREAAERIFTECCTDGFAFDFEALMLADAMGMRVEQIGVSVVNHRDSGVNVLKDSLRMLRDVFKTRRRLGRVVEKL